MPIIRCTRKLLAHVEPPTATYAYSTTRLGDFYAQPVNVGRRRSVLLISQHSRLLVVMPGRDLKHLADNFPAALAAVLQRLDLPREAIVREIAETHPAVITTTDSRSLLGTLTDFSFMLKVFFEEHSNGELFDAVLWLADTPVGPLDYETPERVTRQVLT